MLMPAFLLTLFLLSSLSHSQPLSTTRSRRVQSDTACFRQGGQLNCAWNAQIVENDGYSHVCEPTLAFLGLPLSPSCSSRSNASCNFDSDSKCWLFDREECVVPPRWRLLGGVQRVLEQSNGLSVGVLNSRTGLMEVLSRAVRCAAVLNNATCNAISTCVWEPSATRKAEAGEKEEVAGPTKRPTAAVRQAEVQVLSVGGGGAAPRSAQKNVRVRSPRAKHVGYVMVTTQVVSNLPTAENFIAFAVFFGEFTLGREGLDPTLPANRAVVPFNSSLTYVQNVLRNRLGMADCVVTGNVDKIDMWGRKSWQIYSPAFASSLRVLDWDFRNTLNQTLVTSSRVVITNHRRNSQIVMMLGSGSGASEPVVGTYSFIYKFIGCPATWRTWDKNREPCDPYPKELPVRMPQSTSLSYSDDANIVATALGRNPVNGLNFIDYVSVNRVNPASAEFQRIKQRALQVFGKTLVRANKVEFVTSVEPYEATEYALTPKILTRLAASDGSTIDIQIVIDVPSPVARGVMGRPIFSFAGEALPGLFQIDTKYGPNALISKASVSMKTGDCIHLGGRFYRVLNDSIPVKKQAGLNASSIIFLTTPIALKNNLNDTSVRTSVGWQVFSCQSLNVCGGASGSTPLSCDSSYLEVDDSADEIKSKLSLATTNEYASISSVSPVVSDAAAASFGEVNWLITMSDKDGDLFLDFKPFALTEAFLPESTAWDPSAGATVEYSDATIGVAPPSGKSRLFFAGFEGTDGDLLALFRNTPLTTLSSPYSLSTFDDASAGMVMLNNQPTKIVYTASLDVADFDNPVTIMNALMAMPGDVYKSTDASGKSDIFLVEYVASRTMRVRFLLNSVSFTAFPPEQSADVPQLFPYSTLTLNGLTSNFPSAVAPQPTNRGLLGTDAIVVSFTEVQGYGVLYDPTSLLGERAVDVQRSPCKVKSKSRDEDFTSAFGNLTAMHFLDSMAKSCSEFEDQASCTDPTSRARFCSWRGVDSPLLTDPPYGVNRNTVYDIWWDQTSTTFNTYRLGDVSTTVNANCTVNLINTIRYVQYLFLPFAKQLEIEVSKVNSTVAKQIYQFLDEWRIVGSDVEKFFRCGENPVIEAQASQGGFVDVWQWIVTTTSYTCMFAYGFAGALMAYRMDKFKLVGFKWQDALAGVLITGVSIFAGGVFGFFIGALPAALISQMYASIPVSLSAAWAISLGVAQGILIVYFDSGRGGSEAEIAFKHGH